MTTATPAKTSALPTEKTEPRTGWEGRKLLLYGDFKVGKSTFASELSDRALFLVTDPSGLEALRIFRAPVRSWQEFRQIGAELASTEHGYEMFVIDTVEGLAALCVEHVIAGLAETESKDASQYLHASDFGYGKAWDAIAQEFRLRIGKLCNLGVGVVFVAYQQETTQKTRTGLEITKVAPKVGMRGMRDWLLGFVDFIFQVEVMQTPEGEQHVLRLKDSENAKAGGRFPHDRLDSIPDRIPLSASALRETLDKVLA